jgi:hypothetical protein
MDEESKIVKEKQVGKNMKKPLMQKEVGEDSPRLFGKRRQGCRHHDPLQSFFVDCSKAAKGHDYTRNQQDKKSNEVDGH